MADARSKIEGWADAVRRERHLRDEAFAYPFDDIAGIRVRHMTLGDLVGLQLMENSMLSRKFPDKDRFFSDSRYLDDAVKFVQFLDLGFSINSSWRKRRIRRKIMRSNRDYIWEELRRYVSDTFLDASEGGSRRDSYWSNACSITLTIAHETGWSESSIRDLPFRRAVQYMRKIGKKYAPKDPVNNPSDKIVFDYLGRKNKVVAE